MNAYVPRRMLHSYSPHLSLWLVGSSRNKYYRGKLKGRFGLPLDHFTLIGISVTTTSSQKQTHHSTKTLISYFISLLCYYYYAIRIHTISMKIAKLFLSLSSPHTFATHKSPKYTFLKGGLYMAKKLFSWSTNTCRPTDDKYKILLALDRTWPPPHTINTASNTLTWFCTLIFFKQGW